MSKQDLYNFKRSLVKFESLITACAAHKLFYFLKYPFKININIAYFILYIFINNVHTCSIKWCNEVKYTCWFFFTIVLEGPRCLVRQEVQINICKDSSVHGMFNSRSFFFVIILNVCFFTFEWRSNLYGLQHTSFRFFRRCWFFDVFGIIIKILKNTSKFALFKKVFVL